MGENVTRHSWNRELEYGLPDCRLNFDRANKQAMHGRMWMEKVFCGNCGCDGGMVTPEWAAHVFFLCDDCAKRYGVIEGAAEVSETLVRGG
jgi:hypothetical protein